MSKKKEKKDPLRALADELRGKGGLVHSAAKLEAGEESTRVEYFRGKDFARYLREKPELMSSFVSGLKPGRSVDDQIADAAALFFRRGYILRTDRKFKKPKPGRKKLVKWPKTLVQYALQDQIWDENSFYSWRYDRPTSPWLYVLSILAAIMVVAMCLFPLAPYWIRMCFAYFLMTLLGIMLGVLAIRYVLFASVWIVTGRSFWVFPNMLSDQVAITEAFTPTLQFTKPEDGNYQWGQRVLALLMSVGTVYMLYSYSPDRVTLRTGAQKAHDQLLEFLETFGKVKPQIGDGTTGGGPRRPNQHFRGPFPGAGPSGPFGGSSGRPPYTTKGGQRQQPGAKPSQEGAQQKQQQPPPFEDDEL